MSYHQQNSQGYNPNNRPPPPPPHARHDQYAVDPRSSQSPTTAAPLGGLQGYMTPSPPGSSGYDRVPRPTAQQYSYTGPAYSPHNGVRAYNPQPPPPPPPQQSYNPQDYNQPYRSASQSYGHTPQPQPRPLPPSLPSEPRPYNPADFGQSSYTPYGPYQQPMSPSRGSHPPPPPVPQRPLASSSPPVHQQQQFIPASPRATASPQAGHQFSSPQVSFASPSADYFDVPYRTSSSPRSNLQPTRYNTAPVAEGQGLIDSQTGWPTRNDSVSPRRRPLPDAAQSYGRQDSRYSRPLPEIPQDPNRSSDSSYNESSHDDSYDEDYNDQQKLFNDLENAVGGSPDPQGGADTHRSLDPRASVASGSFDDSLHPSGVGGHSGASSNGRNSSASPHRKSRSYDEDADYDSDLEAEAGLLAMKDAELQDPLHGRSSFLINGNSPPPPPPPQAQPSAESFPTTPDSEAMVPPGMDIGAWSGGVDVVMTHRNEIPTHPTRSSIDQNIAPVASRQAVAGAASHDSDAHYSGTGGLVYPPGVHPSRRLSFEEGDENLSSDEQLTRHSDIYGSGPPEISFFPPSTTRPLPAPPGTQISYLQPGQGSQHQVPSPTWPRSQSVVSHSSTVHTVPPNRAKTYADYKGQYKSAVIGVENGDTVSSTDHPIDLPVIPVGRRFQPSKLKLEDFDLCREPWGLSSLVFWLRSVAKDEADIREQTVKEALLALFDNKVPNMNFAEAEMLAQSVVEEMLQAEVLVKEEEWLRFGPGQITGVLYQLTGLGCYSQSLHEHKSSLKCYSHLCQRTVKKLDLQDPSTRLTADWANFYGLTKQDIDSANKKDVERQNVMHEIVQTEEQYMDQLNLLRSLYRDHLKSANPPILSPSKIEAFLTGVFGKLEAVQKANEEYLLPQLKYRQKEQGPWIAGFSDIFRDWIRKARTPYIDYAANFVHANDLVRQEAARNRMFQNFLDEVRARKESGRLGWDSFLKAPITRLQRYGLLLSTVLRNMLSESAEKANLRAAIEEVHNVTLECDNRVADMNKKAKISSLEYKLILRQDMKNAGIDLKLSQMGRELLYSGDLQRAGGSRFTWLETHAFLFDNYLVLAKAVQEKDAIGSVRYDVSKMPIPMDLLVLDSSNDDPVVRSSFMGTAPASSGESGRFSRGTSGPVGAQLSHTSTHSSIDSTSKSIVPNTVIEGRDEKAMYPFRVKHLGKETYTLYASSAHVRKEWSEKIVEAKTKHAAALFAQNAEPFKLRVLADTAFATDNPVSNQRTVLIKGTPIARAIDEVERSYAESSKPLPACKARVNCATTFVQPHGRRMVAVGTDYGVYISEHGDTRGWTRAISALRVTQVSVLEDFNLFLLISDKALIAYHLDVVSPPSGNPATSDSIRKAPQKLSGTKDVGFFVTGKMKDRILLFYKKREGLSSTFKILEPILQKSTTQKTRLLSNRRGATDFFRDYDDFYIPTECMTLALFTSSLSVATSKGFEVLNLDKKTPWSIPDLTAPHVASIAQRLSASGTALGMFRLNQTEFLCVYEECAVYVNKHGEISRGVVLEFVGRAKAAALEAGYLVLFDADFVEIRDANNGRLKQVIPGRDLRILDDGSGWTGVQGNAPKSVKLCLQHPEQEKMQLVVELVLNESRREA